jgi:hypothetical protein
MFERFLYDEETQRLMDLGRRTQAAKAQAMDDAWGLAKVKRWDVDLDAGTITFKNPGLVVIATVQVIGSLVVENHSWLWSWANPSVDWPHTRHARLVRHYGRQRGIGRLEEPELRCTMEDAWDLTCLAAQLAEAEGAYRGPFGECSYSFMTFDAPTIFRHRT